MSRGYAAIGLYAPKTDANVGGALRAASCYGAALVVIQGQRFKRHSTDTNAAYRRIPVVHGALDALIPFDCVPVCVELCEGAVSLVEYQHPQRAFYMFGPEDGSLPIELQKRCRDRVYVPTNHCMNLAATVNVLLYDRLAKAIKQGT